jgi:hypothetical protein
MTTKKAPAAAELARREAQSKNDRGEVAPIHVEVKGIALDFNPADLLDDYDAMTALMEQGRPNPMLALLFPDEGERQAALDSLRDENGKLRMTTVVEFLTEVFQASGQGN